MSGTCGNSEGKEQQAQGLGGGGRIKERDHLGELGEYEK